MQISTASLIESASVPEAFFGTASHNASHPAQWYRKDGNYLPITYRQLELRVRHVAAGLLKAGIKPGDRVAILMENRPEWAVADFAILSIGAVTVPLYCTYRPQDMRYVLEDCDARCVITSGGALLRHLLEATAECPDVRAIYALNPKGDSKLLHSFAELEEAPEANEELDSRSQALTRDSLATLIYTSGTTGNPKGVMLSHGNILSAIAAVTPIIDFHADDKMLSFLPLAHVLERLAGHFAVYLLGFSVAFAERPDTVAKNLPEARPTILISVPRLYEVMRNRILGQVANASKLRQTLFHSYFNVSRKLRTQKAGPISRMAFPFLDKLVGEKIRTRFGGKLRIMFSGGAPLSLEVGDFLDGLRLPIIEGYGMTESTALIALTPPGKRKPGTVGLPPEGIDIRISDDGEIQVHAPNITKGYWNLPKATKETLIDGWLHTGDIGEFDEDGYLRITGRKKEIIVTSGGENIAPQRVEGLLITDALIEQAAVFGDRRPYLVAAIVPSPEACLAWATAEGLPETDWKKLAESKVLRKALQSRANEILKPLNPFEQVRRILVLEQPFSVENEMLTPTLKVRRNKVLEIYGEAIEDLYST